MGGIIIKQYLEIGKIVTTHGIKGEVKVQPWCDSPDFLCGFDNFYLNNGKEKIEVSDVRIQKNMVIMKLVGIDTPEQAVTFRNKVIYINRNDAELDEGSYFVQDLIGLKVIDADTSESYGELVDVSETGANDVYHIKAENGKEFLIPAIPDVIIKTDIDEGIMLIRPLKGLFDDED